MKGTVNPELGSLDLLDNNDRQRDRPAETL
eukprot:SAG31_NODE_3557_length_4124_cov_8.785342_4_plen_30_part_00